MLEALEAMRPGMSPPLSWLLALDDALLARSNATSWGESCRLSQVGLAMDDALLACCNATSWASLSIFLLVFYYFVVHFILSLRCLFGS